MKPTPQQESAQKEKLTPQQEKAIHEQGQVIVSASAGSGKTFVMIERLVSLVLGKGSIKNVLALTFTNKAAAQMRERLRKALGERMSTASAEERTHLKEQLLALPLADISTIHAFCGRLVRTNFFLAGVDAGFRIISADDAEGKTLSGRALDEVFEEQYAEKNGDFYRLLAAYFHKKKDSGLRDKVLKLHEAVRGLSDYRAVLERIGRGERFEEASDYLYGYYRSYTAFFVKELEEREAFFAEFDPEFYQIFQDVLAAFRKLYSAGNLFEMAKVAAVPPVITETSRRPRGKGEERKHLQFLSAARKEVKELYPKIAPYGTREEARARYLSAEELARSLALLVRRYDDIYSRMKEEAGVLDYNDLEQLALKVLQNDEARNAVRERYRFVFVDEYQDVNPTQEQILSLLAGENIFLVGDGKQAIYGFRGSQSKYFKEKCASLPVSLELSTNFRSSKAVLDAVNRVFAPLIEGYTPMEGGERYGEHRGEVLFHYIPKKKPKGKGKAAKDEKQERSIYSVLTDREEKPDDLAEKIADLIEEEVGSKTWYDVDEKPAAEKRVHFGDIAVLVRKNSGDAERIVHALSRRDIPVTTTSKVNVCDFYEARLIIDCLSYLDNPEQDIPLASALLSAAGGFTEDELATIRLRFPSAYAFRTACIRYRDTANDAIAKKLLAFYEKFERLRHEARVQSAAETAVRLLAEGIEAQIAAKPEGELRLARVRRLIAEAEDCPSIHAFLARLKATNYRIEYAGGGGDDAVKVLTMHSSKGLEYPVVFLASLDTAFHGAERKEIVWTEKFLFAPHCYDIQNKLKYNTVLRGASAVVQEEEELAGELNLLYVAMTRARYRLHMMFSECDRALSPRFAGRFSDFVDLPAFEDLFTEESEHAAPVPRKGVVGRPDALLKEEILAQYQHAYHHAESLALPVKSSATELMQSLRRPVFVRVASDMGGGFSVETGLAYHAFLENVRFGADAEEELARMLREDVLSKEECSLLEAEKLRAILQIPCFQGLERRRLWREQTFLVSLPACEMLDTPLRDEIVYQGAIDLLIEGENGYEIIDYKYSAHDDERIRTDYALQIKLYKKAVARAMRVDENTISARIINIALCREIPM